MPSSDLYGPDAWIAGTRTPWRIAAGVAILLMVIIAAFSTVVLFDEFGISGAKYGLLFTLLLLVLLANGCISFFWPLHRDGDVTVAPDGEEPRLNMRYSAPHFLILAVLMAICSLISLLAVIDYARGSSDPAFAATQIVIRGAFGVICGSYFVSLAMGHLARGRLVLSQAGIYQRGRAFESFLPWEVLIRAETVNVNHTPQIWISADQNAIWERRQFTRFWKLDRLPLGPSFIIDCTVFAIDRNVIRELVFFYLENPGSRHELGTPASLARARAAHERHT